MFGDGDVNFTNVLWIKEAAAGNFGMFFYLLLIRHYITDPKARQGAKRRRVPNPSLD